MRKFVTTFVSLGYWLSFLRPVIIAIRRALELVCCRPFRFQIPGRGDPAGTTTTTGTGTTATFNNAGVSPDTATTGFNTGFTTATDKRGFRAFAGRVWANRGNTVDAQTLFLAGIGARDQNGQPYLAKTETENPFFTVMVNTLAGPLLAKLPDDTLDTLKNTGSIFARSSFAQRAAAVDVETSQAREQEIDDLKTKVSELQNAVTAQAEIIETLRKNVETKTDKTDKPDKSAKDKKK